MTDTDAQALSRDDLPLTVAFLITLAATLGALFVGEVLRHMPKLPWLCPVSDRNGGQHPPPSPGIIL
ncbi:MULTISPECIES: hypothetical protein [Paracoccus]|uniref:hypothetical protein n=1 Tax=Paracoccus TaxID=265 RepID=UPI0013B06D98|nr:MULTISPECIES: hypothetical protein [Paracoccus]WEF25852.1 hypothetical protein PXD02_08085 [Paracoccus sp. S3-43]